MGIGALVRDTSIGLASGLAGMQVMDPVTTKFYAMASEADKAKEGAAQSTPAYDVAAEKLTKAVGLQLPDEQIQKVASGFHYGLGLGGGTMYVVLRRQGLGPWAAALLMGLGLWAGVDEGVNAAMGFSAPPRAYPLSTHLRGLAGHLALGFGVAVAAEGMFTLTWSRPS